jgi:hypothetical protein
VSFTALGSLGSTSTKSAGGTLSLSPSRTVPGGFGRLIAVFVAWEGDRAYSDAAGVHELSIACTDSVGNVYAELVSGLYDVSESIFVTLVDNDLTTSDAITITHRSTLLHAKAISAEEFEIPLGMVPILWRDQVRAAEDPFSGDPRGSALTMTGLDSGEEYLLLHCVGNLRPSSDTYTWDSDYTQITPDGTTGGAASSNVTVLGGYRIVSGITSDTVDIANTTADTTDMWQGFAALSLAELDDDFPTFPNFDDFNRADVDPLPNPPWSASTTITPGQGSALLRNVSNQCARSSSGTLHGAMFWDLVVPAGDDGEAFVTLAVRDTGGAAPGIHVFAAGSGQVATLSGYAAYWVPVADARPDHLDFGDTGNSGGIVARAMHVWADSAAGYKWGLQMRESGVVVHLWADLGLGWRWVAGWRRTAFVSNGGMFGLNMGNGFVVRLDDFGGGTSVRFIPQIIRRPPDPDGARLPP